MSKEYEIKTRWSKSNNYSWEGCFYWVITWKLMFSGSKFTFGGGSLLGGFFFIRGEQGGGGGGSHQGLSFTIAKDVMWILQIKSFVIILASLCDSWVVVVFTFILHLAAVNAITTLKYNKENHTDSVVRFFWKTGNLFDNLIQTLTSSIQI